MKKVIFSFELQTPSVTFSQFWMMHKYDLYLNFSQRQDGLDHLREELGWEHFSEDSNPRRGIHLDFLYDNLMFMAKSGFPWNEVCTCVDIANEMIEESRGE